MIAGRPISEAPADGSVILASIMRRAGVPTTGHCGFRRVRKSEFGWAEEADSHMHYGNGAILGWWPADTPESDCETVPRTNFRYRPTSGAEGDSFQHQWCVRCRKDAAHRADPESGDGCPIVASTFVFEIDEDDYPAEWTYRDDGQPICTAFEPDDGSAPRCHKTSDLFS